MPSRPSAGATESRRATSAPAQLDVPAETDRQGEARQPARPPERAPSARSKRRRPRIVVKGGDNAIVGPRPEATLGQAGSSLDYPIQLSKVQAPPLRDETLARDRLLDWLSVKIHRRVVLLVAEAGYGKTTLLADFSRRTRVRVLWFRLDRGDRDWVGFIAHLVAALRVHVPGFGAATAALLRETATSAPSLETVLDTFLRELGGLPNDPTAFVFDDVHLVDDSPDVRHVLRELLARGPERMSFVFASRREPPIRLARQRALGEVAELATDDLRFDAAETERLFRETYEMRLEPAVLLELSRRTEGWAASLQLVRAALHDRNATEVRTFISSLSGAEGHLYEYLAEEVIGDLSPELQQFLMRTSLLETVDLRLGPVAAGISEDETRAMIDEAERHGLFGRGGPNTRHVARAHPLVRDFLQARLERSIGPAGITEIHLEVARAAERIDWEVASRHYLAGAREEDARRVISAALETILATGAYAAAEELASCVKGELVGVAGLVLRSRLAQRHGDLREALKLAESAWAADKESTAALLNLVTTRTAAGDVAGALAAGRMLERSGPNELAGIARVYMATMETSVQGSVVRAADEIERLVELCRARGAHHFLGVALLNLAITRAAMGEFESVLKHADESIALLSATSAGVELISARLARAGALAFLGDIDGARAELETAISNSGRGQALEVANEVGQIEAFVGESRLAWPLIEHVNSEVTSSTDSGEQTLYARALLRIQDGDLEGARRDVNLLRHEEPRSAVAFESRRYLLEGLLLSLEGDEGAPAIRTGINLAGSQGARLWKLYGDTLAALVDHRKDPAPDVLRAAKESPVVLSMLAEPLVRRLPDFDESALKAVAKEARERPWRWRPPARRLLESGRPALAQAAAGILEEIGELADIPRLREAARRSRGRLGSRPGYELARKLADRVFVEDLGRVRILVGSHSVEGGEVRRKVLALLCLLLSKPRFAATREEVIDSLWPEHDPASALNSLNQTVYFLRRVFEPEYRDDTSPGYVGQDGETIWLDPELIDCRSRRCLGLIRSMPEEPTPDGSVALAREYRGRFALDFAYEEWSTPYRDALHAAYLRVMEHAIRLDLDGGQLGRGTFLAEHAAEVDPDAEDIQVALVRLYRHSGAHSAAAEQYAHYARSMRDLGVEPPALTDL
jgi:DNA-binding SARP family transcriptional activator/tetratricopeptide (TPR) repeat protein